MANPKLPQEFDMAKEKATRRKVSKRAERQIRLSGLRGNVATMRAILDGVMRQLERLGKLEGRNER